GTGFSYTPGSGLNYIAFVQASSQPSSSSAFAGLWQAFVGANGSTGATGATGAAGQSAYLYIGYASDSSGTGFSLTPGTNLNFIAVLASSTQISSPQASNFTGLWKQYGSTISSVASPLTLTGGQLGVNAASANTANYLVQRDGSGNFMATTATLTSAVIGSATLSFASSALQINTAVVVSGLTVGTLSGILQAAGGVISGSATTDNLTEGTTNQYFTRARVLATPLAGYTTAASSPVLLSTDTILSALGKLDAALVTVTGYAALTGATFTGGVTLPAITLTQPAATSGTPNALVVTGGAHTGLAGSTEASDVSFNFARTVQFATGAITLQRAAKISAPTYAFAAASTITDAATLGIGGGPVAGTNATITNAHGVKIGSIALSAGNTNGYGLFVDAPTGAANNYAAVFNTGNVGIGTAAPTSPVDIAGSYLRLRTAHTPSSSSEAGNQGELFWDATYLYCRTASGTVKRIAWTTF
ncbi:MAG: hypothetical protein KGL39_50070, partial [Patescibacteria group bacterium]|nr:hypothetical protein [Patescibacteria group bacterium]